MDKVIKELEEKKEKTDNLLEIWNNINVLKKYYIFLQHVKQ